jgi:hypothetical protein
MLNEDYRDMLRALSDEKVKFLLVGAYALAAHGYPRATMDIDIWVMPSPQNPDAVLRALHRFGAPLHNLTKEFLTARTRMKENQHIEYKESWRDEYLKWICGFANADGGVVVIGGRQEGK